MNKATYEALIEQRRAGPGTRDRAARLEDAAKNRETLDALVEAQADERAKAKEAEPARPDSTEPTSPSPAATHPARR